MANDLVQAPTAIDTPEAASQHVFQIATGYIASTALYVAVRLKIADRLVAGPKSAADLAEATNANEDALYRVLRLLATLGVFTEVEPRTFANNLPAKTMVSGERGSTYDMALWMADPFHFRVYAHAMHSVMTGQSAVEKATGAPVFEVFEWITGPHLEGARNDVDHARRGGL